MTLTVPMIVAMQPGETLQCGKVPGLHIRAFPTRKSYYLYFRTKTGLPRRPKIGDFGTITLPEARVLAKAMLVRVAAGEDPMAQRGAARESPTVEKLCEIAMERHFDFKKDRKGVQLLIDSPIVPKLGHLRVCDVEFDDVQNLHSAMKATPIKANRVVARLSKIFNLAERWKLRPPYTNPCRGIERYPENKRRRFAKPGEWAKLGPILKREAAQNPQSVAFLWLLIYTGARPGDIANARREWLHEDGALELPDGKTGSRTVYLPAQALEALKAIGPQPNGTLTGIKSPVHLWNKIRAEAGCPDLRMYPDLRRSFATTGMANSQTIDVMGGLLGHKNRQTTMVYARLMDETAKDAVAITADALDRMMTPTK